MVLGPEVTAEEGEETGLCGSPSPGGVHVCAGQRCPCGAEVFQLILEAVMETFEIFSYKKKKKYLFPPSNF